MASNMAMIVKIFSCFVMAISLERVLADTCIGTSNICYNYHNNSHGLLINQVNLELKASYFYQMYGHYFDRSEIALPGIYEYFLHESLHERTHADNLLRYINKRGGRPTFSNIDINDMCDMVTNSLFCNHVMSNMDLDSLNVTVNKVALWAFQDALSIEKNVTDALTQIISKDDHQLSHFIEHEYLDEQIQTLKRLGSFVGQLNAFSDSEYVVGQYAFERNLAKNVQRTFKMNQKREKDVGVYSSHIQWDRDAELYDSLYTS